MARPVRFDLIADASRYSRGMRQAQRDTQRFTDHTHRAGSAVKAAFAAFSAATVVIEMRKWVAAARDANRVAAQTNAVIKSTRGAAGLSAKGFSDLAKQISKTAAVDDDLVQGGENILATFTKIKAGGPEKVFERASSAAVDMTAALNQGQVSAEGLQAANLVLGKALNDPIAGLSRLQRVGVSFTQQQKDQIKRFVEHGQVAKAQGVILAEVNREFGGSAAAAVTPAKQLAVTWGNMQEVLGNLLIPAIDRGAVIMTDILEVVDGNRTAFGILFGVLAGGAAIIAGLILAEKIHRAIVDATKVATAAWTTVQKGANLVLGQTKVQAITTAAAEETLAASTEHANAAAARSVPIWAKAAGGLLLFGAGMEATSRIQEKATGQHERGIATFLRTTGVLSPLADLIPKYGKATADAADAAKANADALGDLLPRQQQQAEKTAAVTQKTTELTGKLKDLKQGFKDQVQAVRDSIESYDGLITKSDVTAAQVVRDLNTQVRNFQTYSVDVKRLIKAGVSPAAIEELSKKGPQFVHALATGSNRELQTFKSYWADRQREIRTSFADSMQRQYEGLVRKIRAMQAEINKLKGKTVSITASFGWQGLQVFRTPGGALAMAGGGRVTVGSGPTADDVLARVSKGETVVTASDSARPEFQAWAKQRRIPGYARGGVPSSGMTNSTAVLARRFDQFEGQMENVLDLAETRFKRLAGRLAAAPPHVPGGWQVALRFLSSLRIPYNVISTFRPGARTHASGSVSYHALNRAVDLTGPDMLAIWSALARTNPTELIYSHAPRYKSRSGWHPIGQLDPITFQDHLGHVHDAYRRGGRVMDHGGWIYPGLNMVDNRTGRPERVPDPQAPLLDDRSMRKLARYIADENIKAGLGAVNLDSRRVEQVLAGARLSNARR